MAKKHWLVEAYLALADVGSMTEPEGRATLKQVFPNHAHLIDGLVSDFKDEAMGVKPMATNLRVQFDSLKGGNAETPRSGSLEDGQDVSTIIRDFRNSGRIVAS